MIKNKAVALVFYVFLFFSFWNVSDYLYITFITQGTFTFNIYGNVILPVAIALLLGYSIVYKGKDRK